MSSESIAETNNGGAQLLQTPVPDTHPAPSFPTMTLGEYLLVHIERGKEEVSPGGIIKPKTEKAELERGKVLSVGMHALEAKYFAADGYPVRVGDTVLFSAKAGVKLDGQHHIVDIDSVFGVERQ